jgi:putative transposase
MILKSFKYRINPTKEQKILLNKHIDACRFIYNLALETKKIAFENYKTNISCFDLIKQIPDLKEECVWLKEINSQSLQASIKNLDVAYENFFKGNSKFPKFKSKKLSNNSFKVPQSVIIKDSKLIIPKFKRGINITLHRIFEGKIKQCTISRTPVGKYFVSVLVETTDIIISKKNATIENTVGIDLGIKDFLTMSNGNKIKNPKFLKKSLSKLKYNQRKFSKHRGKKYKLKLQKIHEKVVNQRKDFLHKVSREIVNNHDTLAIETLKIKNMVKNHNLAQAISDVSWGSFVSMIEYKSEWYGTNVIKIGTFVPSSKTCSKCGTINKELKLSDRIWICQKCKIKHDRDINASINIKKFALESVK